MFIRFSNIRPLQSGFCFYVMRFENMYKLKNRIHSILNAIANAMSTNVAFSNKVMDTRLPLPVGRGDKYDVSACCWGHWLHTCCPFFKYPSPDTKVSTSPSGGEVLKLIFCSQCVPDEVAHTPKIPGLRIRRGLFIITLIFKL